MKIVAALAVAGFLAACSTTAVPLTYQASGQTGAKGSPVAGVVSVTDARGEDPKWLGAIRGGFGQQLKTLTLEKPASDVVREALTAGLQARGLLAASNPRYQIAITLRKFDCSQYVRREAYATFDVTMTDVTGAHPAFVKPVVAAVVQGDRISLDTGIFASVEDLRAVANQALQQAVDQLLDDPVFRQALA